MKRIAQGAALVLAGFGLFLWAIGLDAAVWFVKFIAAAALVGAGMFVLMTREV